MVFRIFSENHPVVGSRSSRVKLGMFGMISMLLVQAYVAEFLGNLCLGVGIGLLLPFSMRFSENLTTCFSVRKKQYQPVGLGHRRIPHLPAAALQSCILDSQE